MAIGLGDGSEAGGSEDGITSNVESGPNIDREESDAMPEGSKPPACDGFRGSGDHHLAASARFRVCPLLSQQPRPS